MNLIDTMLNKNASYRRIQTLFNFHKVQICVRLTNILFMDKNIGL